MIKKNNAYIPGIQPKQRYSNMIKHPAQMFIDKLWNKIDSDCYYNFQDMPAHYNQMKKVQVIQIIQPATAFDYKLNKVLYPNDISSRDALIELSQNFLQQFLDSLAKSEDDSEQE